MKNYMLAAIIQFVWQTASAQDLKQAEVPASVVNAFQKQFPSVAKPEWERNGVDYEAEFSSGSSGQEHKIVLDSSGKILSHKEDLAEAALPAAVKATITRDFPGFRLDDPEKMEKNGMVTYKVEVEKEHEEWDLVLDNTGKLLEKKAEHK